MIKLLLGLLLFTPQLALAEEEPPAEYPYPQRTLNQIEDLEQPIRKGNQGEYFYDTKKKKPKKNKVLKGVQQPTKVGSDGSYYYGTEDKKKLGTMDGIEQPIDKDGEGGYYYTREKKKKKAKVKYGPKPNKVNRDGSYVYNVKVPETKNTVYFRGGVMGAPDLKPSTEGGRGYKDIYGTSSSFLITFEYDWQLTHDLFIKAGSGFTNTKGKGQFAEGANPGLEPRESFQFYIFPNTLSLAYKFQLWNIQYLTPYIEAGPGYFTFIENRSDGDIFSFDSKTTKFGGAFVGTATVGLLISMSKFISGTNLLTDYGATQSWLDIQYKQVVGLDSRKDFSSNMITGGFAIGF